jgi:glycosyltransferase involved in cell wall biosynthesis
MASGLPVVATAVGGNVEVITDDADGVLVAPITAAAIGRAIVGLLSEPARRAALGAAARALVQERYGLTAVETRWAALYESCRTAASAGAASSSQNRQSSRSQK